MKLTEDQQKLVEDNKGLVGFVINKQYKYALGDDDACQCGCLGLIEASQKFDATKGYNFSTYATTCIYNRLRRYYRDQHLKTEELYNSAARLDTPLRTSHEGETVTLLDQVQSPTGDETSQPWVDEFLSTLSPTQQAIIQYISDGFNQYEIGKLMGKHQTAISQQMTKIKHSLYVYNLRSCRCGTGKTV